MKISKTVFDLFLKTAKQIMNLVQSDSTISLSFNHLCWLDIHTCAYQDHCEVLNVFQEMDSNSISIHNYRSNYINPS